MKALKDMQLPEQGTQCVLLLSGGLDSSVLLAALREAGWTVHALTVVYGQRHAHEIACATEQARGRGCTHHEILKMPESLFAGSALTDETVDVPMDRPEREVTGGTIPATYVPARNLVFLSMATAWAESLNVRDVFIAVNAIDYSGYPDCRPQFVRAFGQAAGLGTGIGVRVHAPMQEMTKAQIVRAGVALKVDFARTSSCYRPDEQGRACGRCDSCLLRGKGFAQAGVTDPVPVSEV